MSSGDNQNDGFEQFEDGAFESLDGFSEQGLSTPDADSAEALVSSETSEAASVAPVPDADFMSEPGMKDKQGMVAKLTDLSPYSVMLMISLFAVFVCIFVLWSELASYEYDRKAKDAVGFVQPVETVFQETEWV